MFITHPVFQASGFGRHHPLAIPRQKTVLDLAGALGWIGKETLAIAPIANRSTLGTFHDTAYLSALEAACRSGSATPQARSEFGLGTMECPIFDGLWDRLNATVGGAILAADLARQGSLAFHPAGGTHHGRRERASGFCYSNDPVFAILRLLETGSRRVLYVDLDAHHGDGVEDAFAYDARVKTISVHEAGRWPFTGALSDRGGGYAHNVPVPADLNDDEFETLIRRAVLPLAERFHPDAVVVVAGVDALVGDPLSGLKLSNGALWDAVMALVALDLPTVVLGGGGYNPWTLARGWTGLWGRLSGRAIPDRLPPSAVSVLAPLDCDLVDEDDRDPAWLSTLQDLPRPGPVRSAIDDLVRAVLS